MTLSSLTDSPPPVLKKSKSLTMIRRSNTLFSVFKFHSKPQKTKPKPTLPPSLATELALMQFLGGGSAESNVKHFVEQHSNEVYRDSSGRVWLDRDEQLEYAHLLNNSDADEDWVSFHDQSDPIDSHSSLDFSRAILPAEEDVNSMLSHPKTAAFLLLDIDALPVFPDTPVTPRTRRPRPRHVSAPPPVDTAWPVFSNDSYSNSDAKREFLDSSFAPQIPLPSPPPSTTPVSKSGSCATRNTLRGFFKRRSIILIELIVFSKVFLVHS